jgi:Macrocin-O-methyltransferase (TylF)
MAGARTVSEVRQRVRKRVRRFYVRRIRPHLATPLAQQRARLAWQGWSYLRLLGPSALPVTARLRLIGTCLRTDWTLAHAHRPPEIAPVLQAVASRPAAPDEAVVEAGCWQGGATVKLSRACAALGYRLWVYDSFEGVEPHVPEEGEYDFTGEYQASPTTLQANLARLGRPEVVTVVEGWFEDTLGAGRVPDTIHTVLVDCDLGKGTREVLDATRPHLTPDARVFTQDFHIPEVRTAIADLGLDARRVAYQLAEIRR